MGQFGAVPTSVRAELPRIAEACTAITWLVSEYGHKEQAEQRRAGCTPPTSLTRRIVL